MEYLACILASLFLSSIYTNIVINKYDKVITKHIKNTSEITFDSILELLKKLGVIKK